MRLGRRRFLARASVLALMLSGWPNGRAAAAAPAGRAAGDAAGAASVSTNAPSLPFPVPDDQPADYPLASGHFFSQAVPEAARGFGFTVADAGGIPLWSEYQRLGGLERLGYPLSRRFLAGESVAQAFQGGLLRWRAGRGQAEIASLQKSRPLLPDAARPEPPARLGGSAAHLPWSGWWWPATTSVAGPHLFDPDGPLAKYDLFVSRNGRDDPQTLEWEQAELRLDGLQWAGHCNGWAAAALLEVEPTQPRDVGGTNFGVADLKGLLAAYHFADAAAWLDGNESGLSPFDFHRRLLLTLGLARQGFILTFRPSEDEEVWSYPAYRFELIMSDDPLELSLTHVTARVWLADNDVAADFVGLRPWREGPRTIEYVLRGPRDAPTTGEWEGLSLTERFARPAFIWYPDRKTRNLDRQLASPNLDYRTIRRILRGK